MSNKYEYIVNRARDFITLINREYNYEIVNDAYCEVLGQSKEKILRRNVAEVWGEEKFRTVFKPYLDRCFAGEEIHYVDRFEFGPRVKRMHVSFYPYEDDASGSITHALVFSHDITRLSEIESRLAESQYRDAVTGLLNRRSMDVVMDKELEKAKRSSREKLRAFLFIALKNFKRINQRHGHRIGDLLLENTGLRVAQTLRKSDYVFRFEGTNLTVLLTSITRDTDPAVVAQKLIDAIEVPYRYKDTDLSVWCYVGVSVFPDDARDKESLIQHANSAVIEAEAHHKPFLLYDSELHSRAVARMTLQTELRRAFEAGQFELYYQPIVDSSGVIHGAEALIRWHHPTRGLVTPGSFLRLAEETDIVGAIDKWALYSLCRRLREWSERYDVFLTMNMSTRELSDEFLLHVVRGALKTAGGVTSRRLKLELSESRCMEDPEDAIERMGMLRELGIDIWIDDFGAGQSSLSYLKRLPAPVLKIDRSFLDELKGSQADRDYLESIVAGIRARGKEIVAEGVSDEKQLEMATSLGCTLMQGYHFSRPVPGNLLARYLEEGTVLPTNQ